MPVRSSCHWRRNWGSVSPVASRPPPYHRVLSVLAGVPGERDGVAGDLARVDLAEPQPHQHAALAQPGEEPGLVLRLLRRRGDPGPEHGPGHHAVDRRAEALVRRLARPSGPGASAG